MVRTFTLLGLALGIATGLTSAGARGQVPAGPPQFLSAPIHAPEQLQERIQGWLTFAATEAGKLPESPSASTWTNSQFSGEPQSSSAAVDTTSSLSTTYQGEPAITVTPDLYLIGGFNSIDPGNCTVSPANCAPGATVASVALQGGSSSWHVSFVPIFNNLLGFDPSLATDARLNPSGFYNVYYSYGVCSGSCKTANLMLAASDSNTLSNSSTPWQGYQVTAPQSGTFDDKPWVATDPGNPGLVYVAWDRNQGNNQTIYVTRTKKSGAGYSPANGWTKPVKVNAGTSKSERVIYAMPAVANDATNNPTSGCGSVHVVWMDYARKQLFADRSVDCGATWKGNVSVASLGITFTDIGCNGGRSMTPAPYIAVDDTNSDNVYVTYADIKGTTGMDVYFVYSNDGGVTWSNSYRVNDDNTTTHQYNPAMSVAGGQVHVSWLDRRDDQANCLTETYSTAAVFPVTFPPTFSQNKSISGQSNFNGNPNGPGDYSGNTSYVQSSTDGQPLFASHPVSSVGAFDIDTAQVTP